MLSAGYLALIGQRGPRSLLGAIVPPVLPPLLWGNGSNQTQAAVAKTCTSLTPAQTAGSIFQECLHQAGKFLAKKNLGGRVLNFRKIPLANEAFHRAASGSTRLQSTHPFWQCQIVTC